MRLSVCACLFQIAMPRELITYLGASLGSSGEDDDQEADEDDYDCCYY